MGKIIFLLLSVLIFVAGCTQEAALDNPNTRAIAMEEDVKVFNVNSVNFKFLMGDVESPDIKVKKGDKVRIVLTSSDGFHDWVVDEFNAATAQVSSGNSVSVEFIADKAGVFEYYCSVGQHRSFGMKGNLIVEDTIGSDSMEDDLINHVGCQEGEIDDYGNCWPAEQTNAQLFDDVDVDTMEAELGFIARPKVDGNYPGVLMIHEWWGLNENVKDMARVLAKEGYVVYAVDLYGEVATESSKAGELAGKVRSNPDVAIEKMKQAIAYLRETGSGTVGSLGWCFGGQQSLQISLNEKLDSTVIYYGQLTDNETQLSYIEWPVLGIFGEQDASITPESVRRFESSLNNLGIQNEIYIYEGVGHAFANPSGSRYGQEQTIDAWEKTVSFLAENLK